MAERFYTTHQVARMFGVTMATVVNWEGRGLIHAQRTAGGHRRISRRNILTFAKDNGHAVPAELFSEHGIRVLVVDDEPDFGDMIRDYLLANDGFSVEVAASGFQAGFAVAKFKPDIILMDIMMPDMDGFEVQSRLKADPDTRHIPVIACTAYGDADLDARLTAHGFDGYVAKPIRLNRLMELIRERFQV
ncbi:MAG: excisionase family DNA binding protein [Myxococcota bacterium]|jgi:excisionase family DNA binding protein